MAHVAILALGKSGKYNTNTKNIDSGWIEAFKKGMEKFKGRPYVVQQEEKAIVHKVRKKCTCPGWNFERVYKMKFGNKDPVELFQETSMAEPDAPIQGRVEERIHSQFPIATSIRLIGRKLNISPLAPDDENLYYIARGSVMCKGTIEACDCTEGCIRVMVQEIFPHDGPLQKFGGEIRYGLSTHVLQLHSANMWHESLVRLMPKENIRSKPKPGKKSSKKGGKENKVRKSTRKAKYSSKIIEIINNGGNSKPSNVGAKRGRKRKGGAPVRAIEASKPVTSVVERPGKRRTTKLALN